MSLVILAFGLFSLRQINRFPSKNKHRRNHAEPFCIIMQITTKEKVFKWVGSILLWIEEACMQTHVLQTYPSPKRHPHSRVHTHTHPHTHAHQHTQRYPYTCTCTRTHICSSVPSSAYKHTHSYVREISAPAILPTVRQISLDPVSSSLQSSSEKGRTHWTKISMVSPVRLERSTPTHFLKKRWNLFGGTNSRLFFTKLVRFSEAIFLSLNLQRAILKPKR